MWTEIMSSSDMRCIATSRQQRQRRRRWRQAATQRQCGMCRLLNYSQIYNVLLLPGIAVDCCALDFIKRYKICLSTFLMSSMLQWSLLRAVDIQFCVYCLSNTKEKQNRQQCISLFVHSVYLFQNDVEGKVLIASRLILSVRKENKDRTSDHLREKRA